MLLIGLKDANWLQGSPGLLIGKILLIFKHVGKVFARNEELIASVKYMQVISGIILITLDETAS